MIFDILYIIMTVIVLVIFIKSTLNIERSLKSTISLLQEGTTKEISIEKELLITRKDILEKAKRHCISYVNTKINDELIPNKSVSLKKEYLYKDLIGQIKKEYPNTIETEEYLTIMI